MPFHRSTRNFDDSTDTIEKLMRTADRECYIGGQLNELRRLRGKRGAPVTLGDALCFKGRGRDSYYVERLAAATQRDDDPPKKSVQYLLKFAARACRLFKTNELEDMVPRFRRAYDDHLDDVENAQREADDNAKGGWLKFLSDNADGYVDGTAVKMGAAVCPHAPGTEEYACWMEEHKSEMTPV